MKQFVESDTTV